MWKQSHPSAKVRVVDERHFAKSSENADPVCEKVVWYRFRTVSENRLIYVSPRISGYFSGLFARSPEIRFFVIYGVSAASMPFGPHFDDVL